MNIKLVSSTPRDPAAGQALGIVEVTGERIGLTERGVAFWEPVFRSRGLPFSRVMSFQDFAHGVRRFATTDCTVIPTIQNMAPGLAKGFLCACFDDKAEVLRGVMKRLAVEKTDRVAFITKAAVGAEPGDPIVTNEELGALFSEEAMTSKRVSRDLEIRLTRQAAARIESENA